MNLLRRARPRAAHPRLVRPSVVHGVDGRDEARLNRTLSHLKRNQTFCCMPQQAERTRVFGFTLHPDMKAHSRPLNQKVKP